MRITKLTLEHFRGFSDKFDINVGGSNVLIYGENGSSKSGIVQALDLLFSPDSTLDLVSHENVFSNGQTQLTAEFHGQTTKSQAPPPLS